MAPILAACRGTAACLYQARPSWTPPVGESTAPTPQRWHPNPPTSPPHPPSSRPTTSPPSPHYGNMTSANDLSSILIGQNGHLGHHLGLAGHGIPSGSPSSPSSAEDFFMVDMRMPQRMKKKGRKPKPLEGGAQPQQPNKRKSREGILAH